MYNLDSYISNAPETAILLPLKDAEIWYYPNFISTLKAETYFKKLITNTLWQEDMITVYGKTYPQPRLTSLYGEKGKPYKYSGITMHPEPFTKDLFEIKKTVETISKCDFSTVLLNLYRNGNDSNGWHADNEKELGINPEIASLSFGTPRFFHLKQRDKKNSSFKLTLGHGSLLIMKGKTQHNWLHQLPKSKKITSPRINLTFRKIFS